MHCLAALSVLIYSDENTMSISPACAPLNSAADIMLVATTASDIIALTEAMEKKMEKQTMLQPCCRTAATHGVQLCPYFLGFIEICYFSES